MLFNDPASCSRIADPLSVVMGHHCFASDVRGLAGQTGLLATKVLLEGEVVGADTGVGVPGMRAGPWGTGLTDRRRQGVGVIIGGRPMT